MILRLGPARGGRLAKQIRQHHQGGFQRHCPATSAANSSNRERGSILKAMDRVAELIESRGGDSGSNMMFGDNPSSPS